MAAAQCGGGAQRDSGGSFAVAWRQQLCGGRLAAAAWRWQVGGGSLLVAAALRLQLGGGSLAATAWRWHGGSGSVVAALSAGAAAAWRRKRSTLAALSAIAARCKLDRLIKNT